MNVLGRYNSERQWGGMMIFLVISALVVAIGGGYAVTMRGSAVTLAIAAIILSLMLTVYPKLVIWLLPIGIAVPRSLPRLFGQLGALELLLFLGVVALFAHRTVHRERLRHDRFFRLMLLAALPIGLSWLAGRGEGDSSRLYIWIGSCLAYLLAINLVTDRRDPYRILGFSSVIVVSLLMVDVWLVGVDQPLAGTGMDWKTYRQTATTVGMGMFAMLLMAMVLPVPLVYGLVIENWLFRMMSLLVFWGGMLLALSFLTRAFIISILVSVLVVAYMLWLRRDEEVNRIAVGLGLALALPFVLMWLQSPSVMDLFLNRFIYTYYYGDPRITIWLGLLERAAESPLWGYGAVDSWARFGIHGSHGLYPQVLFDYGLAFVMPLLLLLFWWFKGSWQLGRPDYLDDRDLAFSLAGIGVVAGVLSNSILNDYLCTHGAYSILAFFLAGLSAAQARLLESDGLHDEGSA